MSQRLLLNVKKHFFTFSLSLKQRYRIGEREFPKWDLEENKEAESSREQGKMFAGK